MPVDSRGAPVFSVSSNRAPHYTDAAIDGTLLAAAASKTVLVKQVDLLDGSLQAVVDPAAQNTAVPDLSTPPTPSIASEVQITNSSGQSAQVTLVVARDRQGKVVEVMKNPLTILNGETFSIYARVVRVIEKNTGASAQTAQGVRYLFTLEPHD